MPVCCSLCPTFSAVAMFINNARWDGVPFLLKVRPPCSVFYTIHYRTISGAILVSRHPETDRFNTGWWSRRQPCSNPGRNKICILPMIVCDQSAAPCPLRRRARRCTASARRSECSSGTCPATCTATRWAPTWTPPPTSLCVHAAVCCPCCVFTAPLPPAFTPVTSSFAFQNTDTAALLGGGRWQQIAISPVPVCYTASPRTASGAAGAGSINGIALCLVSAR